MVQQVLPVQVPERQVVPATTQERAMVQQVEPAQVPEQVPERQVEPATIQEHVTVQQVESATM